MTPVMTLYRLLTPIYIEEGTKRDEGSEDEWRKTGRKPETEDTGDRGQKTRVAMAMWSG